MIMKASSSQMFIYKSYFFLLFFAVLYFQNDRRADSQNSHILRLLLVSKHICAKEAYSGDLPALLESLQSLIETIHFFLDYRNKETIAHTAQQCLFEANYVVSCILLVLVLQ